MELVIGGSCTTRIEQPGAAIGIGHLGSCTTRIEPFGELPIRFGIKGLSCHLGFPKCRIFTIVHSENNKGRNPVQGFRVMVSKELRNGQAQLRIRIYCNHSESASSR